MCDFILSQLSTHLITFVSHRAWESSLSFNSLKESTKKKFFNMNWKKKNDL